MNKEQFAREYNKRLFEIAYNRIVLWRPYIQPYYRKLIKTLYSKMLFGVSLIYKKDDYNYIEMYKNEIELKIKEENTGLYIEVFIDRKYIFDKFIKINSVNKNANNYYINDFLKGLSNLTKFVG